VRQLITTSMLWGVIVLLSCTLACGGPGPGGRGQPIPPEELAPPRRVEVEWKVAQGEGHTVDVTLVVEGRAIAIGPLQAATEHEAGTPSTCALRAASARRTEIVCGDRNAFAADLVDGELVVTRIAADRRDEVKRIPVYGDELAVKILALPLDGT